MVKWPRCRSTKNRAVQNLIPIPRPVGDVPGFLPSSNDAVSGVNKHMIFPMHRHSSGICSILVCFVQNIGVSSVSLWSSSRPVTTFTHMRPSGIETARGARTWTKMEPTCRQFHPSRCFFMWWSEASSFTRAALSSVVL